MVAVETGLGRRRDHSPAASVQGSGAPSFQFSSHFPDLGAATPLIAGNSAAAPPDLRRYTAGEQPPVACRPPLHCAVCTQTEPWTR